MVESKTIGNCQLYLGDCMEILPTLPDSSVDCVIADLPYGTTYAKWDSVLDLSQLWVQYKRIIKKNAPLIFTASQPFTTTLINSNINWFKYEWIWDKQNATNFPNAKRQPLKQHENVLVFCEGQSPYYPIKTEGALNHKQGKSKINYSPTRLLDTRAPDKLDGLKYPKSILCFPKHSSQCKYHPTEKPVELMAYLVKTYTLPGQAVLDNVMGSGTTGVACVNENRHFIGIENDGKYFEIAYNRIKSEERLLK